MTKSSAIWTFLKPGDAVALLSPGALPIKDTSASDPLYKTRLFIDQLTACIQQYGLHASFYGCLNPEQSYRGYYTAPTAKRAEAVEEALEDPKIKALLILRGGFGMMEILSLWESQGRNPFRTASHKKPLVGFSDATHLLTLAHQNGYATLHGSGGISYKEVPLHTGQEKSASLVQTINCLMGRERIVSSQWKVLNGTPIEETMIESTIVGGNLSVLQRNAGTATALSGAGKFVFLEDTEPDAKRQLDLLIHLIRTGGFGTPDNPAKAFLMGYTAFHRPEKGEDPSHLSETATIYAKWLQAYGLTLPICYNPDFGHGTRNHLLPLGTKAHLKVQEKGEAILETWVNQTFAHEVF